MVENQKIFISYTHENKDYQLWADKLATDLRQHMGVDAIYDQRILRLENCPLVVIFIFFNFLSDRIVLIQIIKVLRLMSNKTELMGV